MFSLFFHDRKQEQTLQDPYYKIQKSLPVNFMLIINQKEKMRIHNNGINQENELNGKPFTISLSLALEKETYFMSSFKDQASL